MAVVTVSNVSKRFGRVRAVEDVSFEVFPGEIFGILGPNGAGKTTTIRMMMSIFEQDGGTITLFGEPFREEHKQRIGYMPEERGLYKDQKLEPTLVFLATLKGLDDKTARARLEPWMQRLDLWEHRNKQVQELSKGMQQKAQIIATLIHEPDLVVIDEPFTGLDPVNTRLVKEIFQEQRQAGRAIIMSTHQMHQVEALCNRIVLISRGRSVLYGPVSEIKRNFAGNAIILEGEGTFDQLPGVLDARRENGLWHLSLGAGVSPQEIFRALASNPEVAITHFEVAEPSLEDIFVNVVQEEGGLAPTEGQAAREVEHA
ncbi:MAG: ATP-binding cassette domain-containing protein [Chloroflexi bacterium]|nr:ATP-binding cassette domain-containing protein [Chloroflexota bacterium]